MKTKEEIIKEAYGEYFEKCNPDIDGWFWSQNFIFDFCKKWDKKGFRNTLRFRPKSLQGIENNNNWTKIESESDLPKDKTTQYSVCKDKKVFQSTVNCGTVINWYNIGKISHYQPIKKPEPPLH